MEKDNQPEDVKSVIIHEKKKKNNIKKCLQIWTEQKTACKLLEKRQIIKWIMLLKCWKHLLISIKTTTIGCNLIAQSLHRCAPLPVNPILPKS